MVTQIQNSFDNLILFRISICVLRIVHFIPASVCALDFHK